MVTDYILTEAEVRQAQTYRKQFEVELALMAQEEESARVVFEARASARARLAWLLKRAAEAEPVGDTLVFVGEGERVESLNPEGNRWATPHEKHAGEQGRRLYFGPWDNDDRRACVRCRTLARARRAARKWVAYGTVPDDDFGEE